MAASTRPLAMPITSVAANSTAKLGAAIVATAPPMWPAAASRSRVPMPARSQSGPPTRMDTPNPQNAAPAIQPTSTLLSANSRSKSPMRSPRIANDIAVATSAMQLATKNALASRGDEVCVITGLHERFVRPPHVVGNVLVNLEPLRGIQSDPLQIADHDADHVVGRERAVRRAAQILVHRFLRRGYDHLFLGPHLPERRVAAALHVRLLHDDELLELDAALGEEPLREGDVLPGVRRPVLDQHAVLGDAHARGDSRELIRLGLAPQPARDRAEPAGEDQERRPALKEEVRSARRHDRVVAAEHQDRVRLRELMIHVMVAPERLGERADPSVHSDARHGFRPARKRSTRPDTSFR